MRILLLSGFIISILATACGENRRETMEQDSSEATMATETGMNIPLPRDVLYATKPLINGEIYTKPDFKSPSLASFDTSQSIHVLDSTHAIFVYARIKKDTSQLTGYVPKTILPEKRK